MQKEWKQNKNYKNITISYLSITVLASILLSTYFLLFHATNSFSSAISFLAYCYLVYCSRFLLSYYLINRSLLLLIQITSSTNPVDGSTNPKTPTPRSHA